MGHAPWEKVPHNWRGEIFGSCLSFRAGPSRFEKLFHEGAIFQLHFAAMIRLWEIWRCREQCAANLLQRIEKHDKIKINTAYCILCRLRRAAKGRVFGEYILKQDP